jgi:hypothetical protein
MTGTKAVDRLEMTMLRLKFDTDQVASSASIRVDPHQMFLPSWTILQIARCTLPA